MLTYADVCVFDGHGGNWSRTLPKQVLLNMYTTICVMTWELLTAIEEHPDNAPLALTSAFARTGMR